MESRLSEFAIVTMGQSPKSVFYNSDKKGYPFLQGNRTFGDVYPTFDTWTTKLTKLAKKGDVIMSVRAPVGEINIAPDDFCLGRGVCSIRMKQGDNRYLFYLLKYANEKILSKENGTVFGSINRKDIENLIFDIPSVVIQRKIASILGALDSKIEFNNKMNEKLHEIIQCLYNGWFENYDFFGGERPSSWVDTKITDFAELINGYSYKGNELSESGTAMATIKNFDRTGGFKLDGFKEINPSSKLKKCHHAELFDTLVAHTDLTQGAEVIGNAEVLLNQGGYNDIVFSMDLVKVLPKNDLVSKFFIASILHTDRFKKHCLGYVNGTTVLHLSKKALQDYSLYLPENLSQLKEYSDLIEPIYRMIAQNVAENVNLESLRDTLLPKLMSGEIDVDAIEL